MTAVIAWVAKQFGYIQVSNRNENNVQGDNGSRSVSNNNPPPTGGLNMQALIGEAMKSLGPMLGKMTDGVKKDTDSGNGVEMDVIQTTTKEQIRFE